jgi:hypothetical protein
MKQILIKHKPDNLSKDEWEKTWNNMQYGLSVLHKTLQELKGSTTKVKPDDFSIPNHYALLAFEAGKRQAYQEVIDMLPEGSKNS